jgi:hypothetical protein
VLFLPVILPKLLDMTGNYIKIQDLYQIN